MTPDEILHLIEERGALLRGHFKLTSGRHSDRYLQKQRLFEDPRLAMRLAEAMVERFDAESFDVVAAPAVGAILLGGLVAYVAGTRFVFTERADGAMTLRRGQQLGEGDQVLVVEDIVTTGGSAAEVVEVVRASGASLAGVCVVADRSMTPPGYPLTSLVKIEAVDWDPSECPLCAHGKPLDAPGSRYLQKAP